MGFYWTLPVPWAGFTDLPADLDVAARASRTIRYQREVIRRYARENRYELVHEEAFLEIQPDRGSELILEPLTKVEAICRRYDAVLLFVDFSLVQGWRSHHLMRRWFDRSEIRMEKIYPDEIVIDGERFDPHAHFEAWRERQRRWTEGKAERKVKILQRIRELRDSGFDYAAIAGFLNSDGIRSSTGKPWNSDNVRKVLHSRD